GKKNEGFYFVIEYNCSAEASKEVGRLLKLNEDVLRYQTIRLDEEEPAAIAPAAAQAPAEGGQA
ncbi:MAG: 30S ribosomal protein S6, partial [Deltaproteobacteria bacterium]|nr:30S ribosomal protein S6 [Deltaproteobacteria bacterium]